jgi:hypothetical protein
VDDGRLRRLIVINPLGSFLGVGKAIFYVMEMREKNVVILLPLGSALYLEFHNDVPND